MSPGSKPTFGLSAKCVRASSIRNSALSTPVKRALGLSCDRKWSRSPIPQQASSTETSSLRVWTNQFFKELHLLGFIAQVRTHGLQCVFAFPLVLKLVNLHIFKPQIFAN